MVLVNTPLKVGKSNIEHTDSCKILGNFYKILGILS